ncbi:hypothetical protein [Peribacillus simplex]|nr:hypothetical protein [Peribacillus simplex]
MNLEMLELIIGSFFAIILLYEHRLGAISFFIISFAFFHGSLSSKIAERK